MRWPSRLIVTGCAALFSAAVSARARQTPAPPQTPAPSPTAGSAYVGSDACQQCHQDEYGSWKQTLHVQMTKPIADAKVEGDFRRGTKLEQYGHTYTMETRDGRYFVTVANGAAPPERFEINYTLGAHRFQGYLSKLPDGRIYVLPVFWHNESKRWVDWREITSVPSDPSHELRQIWNVTCVTATPSISSSITIRRPTRTTPRGPRWGSAARRATARGRRTSR